MSTSAASSKSRLSDGLKKATSARRKLPKIFGSTKAATSELQFCYHCGAVLPGEFKPGSNCFACDEVVQSPSAVPPGYSMVDASNESSLVGRRNLEAETNKWTEKGYRVVRQKSDFVELRKPKRFSDKWAMAWLVAGIPLGGPAIAYAGGYAVWHVIKKERSVMLFLSPDGAVRTEQYKT